MSVILRFPIYNKIQTTHLCNRFYASRAGKQVSRLIGPPKGPAVSVSKKVSAISTIDYQPKKDRAFELLCKKAPKNIKHPPKSKDFQQDNDLFILNEKLDHLINLVKQIRS